MAQVAIIIGMTGANFVSGLNGNFDDLYAKANNITSKSPVGSLYQTGLGIGSIEYSVGIYNVGIGLGACSGAVGGGGGYENIGIGVYSLGAYTTGSVNIGIGSNALTALTTGNYNICIGYGAGNELTTGGNNTSLGYSALYSCLTGVGNVAIGYRAGEYETGGSQLFIDNQDRGSQTLARQKSLIYGVFDGTVSAQRLYINGKICVPEVSGAVTDGAPTSLEILNACGTAPESFQAGMRFVIKDSSGSSLLYMIESDGTHYYYTQMNLAL